MNKVQSFYQRSIRTKMWFKFFTAVLYAMPGFAFAAHQDILVNFTVSGNQVSSPDAYGHYWNNDTSVALSGGLSNMVTTNNTATTIGLLNVDVSGALSANPLGPGLSGPAVDPNRVGYFAVPNACSTFYYANSSTGSNAIAINGLTIGNNYNLRWYGARDATETRITGYTLFCGNGNFTTNVQTSGTGLGGTGTNYTSVIPGFSRLAPTTNNAIVFGFKTIAGSFSYVNVMEITVNRPPVAGSFTTNRNAGAAITISTASLLAQSSDPDGDVLNFIGFSSLPAGATTNSTSITLPGTNTIQTFVYTVDDGNGLTNSGTVTVGINGVAAGRRVALIDFGPNDVTNGTNTFSPDYLGQYWNNLNAPGGGSVFLPAGSGLANFVATNNVPTDMGLVINNGNFQANGIVNGGLLTPSYSLLGNFAVTNATEDYIFTTQGAGASLSLTNLDPAAIYRLRLFGTRNTDANTIRVTQYIVTGGNGSFTNVLQTSGNNGWMNNGATYYGNNNTIVTMNGVVPDANKQIQVSVNIAAGGFAYLGVLEVTETKQPPATTSLTLTRVTGLPVHISKSSLAADASGDSLTFVLGTTTNGMTLAQDSDNIYVPANTVADQFSFTVTDGYGGTNSGVVTVLVGKVTPTIAVLPATSAIDYGESLASSTLTGGAATNAASSVAVDGTFAFTSPSLIPNAAGPTNVSVTFTPTDTANYNSATTTVAVAVNGITPTILAPPTASAISFGQVLASSVLSGGVATNAAAGVAVPGNFVFTTPSLAPGAAGATNVSATFIPSDSSYNSTTTTATVLVNKATPVLTAPKPGPLAAGQALASAILTGGAATNGFNSAPVPGSFAFTDPSIVPNQGVTNVSVTFTPTDAADYNSATTTVAVNVTKSIVVFGSSVALGYGSSPTAYTNGSYINGYGGLLTAFLTPGGWAVTNISIGGQTTANGLVRFNTDLAPLAPNYVLIGYGLSNEGLVGSSDPAAITNTFSTNLKSLVSQCYNNGFQPVIGSVYPNNGYSASEYQYDKAENLIINSLNAPSVNFLGALDDGNGHWVSGYYFDALHPNNAGYQELFYSFVPTLFDAITAGKSTPHLATTTQFARLTLDGAVAAPVTFTPSNTMHSFTVSFRVRSTNSGTIAAVRAGTSYATLEIRNDKLVYVSINGQEIAISVNATNGGWHDVALAYRYALTNTTLFVDGVQAGNLSEQYVPNQFILGGPAGASGRPATPVVADFQNWCVYRSAWNQEEAVAQMQGNLQQASMEICATLDDAAFASGSPATNRAQSLSVAMVNTANLSAGQDVPAPGSLTAQPTAGASVILNWINNGTTEDGFVVERRLAGSGPVWADLVVLPAGSTTYTDPGLSPGVTYEYRVAASKGSLRSSYSNSARFAAGTHQDVLIDFGPNDDSNGNFVSSPDYLGQYWNNMYTPGAAGNVPPGSGLANMITTNNIATTMGLIVSSNFQANGIQNGGLLTPSYALLGNFAVTNATEDYIFTTSAAGAGLALTNLDPTAVYRLRMFGTRNTDASSSRITQYVVTGGNGASTNTLQTSGSNGWVNNASAYYGNNNTIITVNGITPDANNQIQVAVNIAAGGFAYLGIMEIAANHVPVANGNTYSRNGLNTWKILVSDLLTNATDADFDPLTLVGVGTSTNGVALTVSGGYVEYSNANQVDDRFSYTVTDGFGGTNSATITLTAGASGGVGGQVSNVAFTNGVASMTFAGIPGYLYHVQVSTNLIDWNDVWMTNAPSGGVFQFNDSMAPMPNAYYRLMWNGN